MSLTVAALLIVVFRSSSVESVGLVEMFSDYAKVVKHTEKPTTENIGVSTTTTTLSPDNTTVDYDDFDDIEEEPKSLNQNPSASTMMKYFNGIVSLLALMYKFNGKFDGVKPQSLHFKNVNEPRRNDVKSTGKRFQEKQDRFDFPYKKFKYQANKDTNLIDQQYQPVENYPPYNPLTANSAETYNKDDKKTSYDSDLTHHDSEKNEVEVQQSYSYEIPYETINSAQPYQDDWTSQIHPVYQPWKHKDETPSNTNSYSPGSDNGHSNGDSWTVKDQGSMIQDSYQPWKPKPTTDSEPSYQSWKTKPIADEPKPDTEPRQPWKDIPIYHHDFKDTSPVEPHFEYHEVEHPMDEDRVNKKPYSYYFLGRKLWYIPLLFSVYFIIYIGALVLKSVARHKIQFPEKLWDLHDDHFGHGKHRRHRKVDEITENYENAMEKFNNKFI